MYLHPSASFEASVPTKVGPDCDSGNREILVTLYRNLIIVAIAGIQTTIPRPRSEVGIPGHMPKATGTLIALLHAMLLVLASIRLFRDAFGVPESKSSNRGADPRYNATAFKPNIPSASRRY